MINPTLTTLLDHRSIRKFTGEKLTASEVSTLVSAAQHAATSTFSQQYSIISVTDPQKLAVLAEITGHSWLEGAGHYFIMVADQYRNEQLTPPNATTTTNLHSTDKLLAGIFDAAIATEAMVTAGESLGLGSTVMGSILNDTLRVISLFNLPELTFPVLGLAVGHPAEQPEQKPRLPQELIHFNNEYQPLVANDPILTAYNQLITAYYHERGGNRRNETFTHHIIREMSRDPKQREEILVALIQQGFSLDDMH